MSRKKSGTSNFNVGNIENSTGIAIGINSTASVNQTLPASQAEIVILLDKFISSLQQYAGSLSDTPDIHASAIAARAEAEKSSPKWPVIRSLLKAIAADVVRIAALTDAVNNIITLVTRLA